MLKTCMWSMMWSLFNIENDAFMLIVYDAFTLIVYDDSRCTTGCSIRNRIVGIINSGLTRT